jgi:hypothetical protein
VDRHRLAAPENFGFNANDFTIVRFGLVEDPFASRSQGAPAGDQHSLRQGRDEFGLLAWAQRSPVLA